MNSCALSLHSYPCLGQHIHSHFRIGPGLQLPFNGYCAVLFRQRRGYEQSGEKLGAYASVQAGLAAFHSSPHHQGSFVVVAYGEGLGPEITEAAQERPIGPAANGGVAGENSSIRESSHSRAEAQGGSGVEDIDHILRGLGLVGHALYPHILMDINFCPKGLAGGDGGSGICREKRTLDASPRTEGDYENGAVSIALGGRGKDLAGKMRALDSGNHDQGMAEEV